MTRSQHSTSGRLSVQATPPEDARHAAVHPVLRLAEVVALRFDGLLPARALREVGVPPHSLRRLCGEGVLYGIRRGVYVAGAHWRAADASERYRLVVRATMLTAGNQPTLSHHSAAVLHGLPIIGGWPATVHTLTPGTSRGSTARFTTSHSGPPSEVVSEIDGCSVTSLARTLVDVAASSSFLVGVTMVDHALRVELERVGRERAWRGDVPPPSGRPALTPEVLYRELDLVNPRTGRRQVERVIEFASPLAANPGETLSRVRIFELGFAAPELQVCFPGILGGNAYVDFWWWRVRKIGEFDGFLKYGTGAVLGDRDPSAVVWQEKLREDALRARVTSFDRWGWDLALHPARFHAFLTERGVPRA
jgi:predicted transcriptional regulator of viral defense system